MRRSGLDESHRFLHYCPALDRADGTIVLTGDEHHHLRRVLRLKSGDTTYVTNGRGILVRASVVGVDARQAILEVTACLEEARNARRVTVALACIKKDAFAQAVKQCTELGATRFVPWRAERSQVRAYGAADVERLQRVALAAMKQSFRALLPEVRPCGGLRGILDLLGEGGCLVVADAQGAGVPVLAEGDPVTIVVGPEAGLSAAEAEVLGSAGAHVVRVSRRRLRSETAAVAMTAVLLAAD